MKRCPKCYLSYETDAHLFCITDGTRLVDNTPTPHEPQQTFVLPAPTISSYSAPESDSSPDGASSNYSGPLSLPPLPVPSPLFSVKPVQSAPKRNPLLLILGGLFLMALGLGVGITVATYNSGTPDQRSHRQAAQPTAESDASTVLAELKALEQQLTDANIQGDKATLESILADDYVATGADGKFYNKAQALATTEPANTVVSWSIDGVKLLSHNKDRATLSGIVTFKDQNNTERQQFTDSFVKRDGRWKIFSSQSTILNN